jgi:hypothetical protein
MMYLLLALLQYGGPSHMNGDTTPAALDRKYPVRPLAIVSFDVRVRTSSSAVKATAFVRFYDDRNNEILTYRAAPVSGDTWQGTGYYTEAPALARTVELGVAAREKDSVWTDSLQVDLDRRVSHTPDVDLGEYLKPFWKSDTIYNETVLLYSEKGKTASGRLLFNPDKIISVRSFDLKTAYRGYRISGRTISGPELPFRADTSFDQVKDFAWYNLQSQWVVVTYTHHDAFEGPTPTYKGDLLPLSREKLRKHEPLRIVAYGMSITRGLDVSGFDTIPPYMPTYVDLFALELKVAYQDPGVVMYNAGLPGSVIDWGADNVQNYVTPLHPDLVILDFGMNDFWRTTPEAFGRYMDTMMAKIPHAEFILLSNMRFDPAYLKNSDGKADWYTSNLLGYSAELRRREGPHVANLDMTTLSGYIYSRKKAKDCVVNPLHPNDYLARWYAQGLGALLIP